MEGERVISLNNKGISSPESTEDPSRRQRVAIAQALAVIHYDEEAKKYDVGYGSELCQAEDHIVAKMIKPQINGNIADIGCGTGLLLRMYPNISAKNYFGCDISPKMVEQARKKYPQYDFRVGDMHHILADNGYFDSLIALYGPPSYSLTPEELLEEWSRVLKSKGAIAAMFYSYRVKYNVDVGQYSTATDRSVPKLFYTEKQLIKLFSKDFSQIKVTGIDYFGNVIETWRKKMNIGDLNCDQYQSLLETEMNLRSRFLPAHLARHILVQAVKK